MLLLQGVEGRQRRCCCSLLAGGAERWHWGGGELGALPLEVGVHGVAQHGEPQQRQQRVGEAQQRPALASGGGQQSVVLLRLMPRPSSDVASDQRMMPTVM